MVTNIYNNIGAGVDADGMINSYTVEAEVIRLSQLRAIDYKLSLISGGWC